MAARAHCGCLALLCLWASQAGAAMTPNAEFYLDRGLKHLYSLEYPESRAAFRRLVELEPDNPFGYLFESGAIWWQSSQEYGLFKDTPTLQGLFEQDVEAAIRKAEPLTRSKDRPQRADGHFVSGMALGTRGQWALMRGHYLKAYFDGKKAVKHLKKAAKLDDEYYDVDLGLGVYDYETAHLSGVAKLGALVGVRGDEERGLERLHRAMEKGRYASRQAAQFLATIYIIDKRDWTKALHVLDRLRADFPDSLYFQSLDALVRWKLGDKKSSFEQGRRIFDRVREDPKSFNAKLLSLVCGLYGEQCLDREHAFQLHAWLTEALDAAQSRSKGGRAQADDASYVSLLHLYRGYAADVLGHTDRASADYRWVLKRPDFSDNRARAKECDDEGCGAEQLLLYMRALSRGDPWPPTAAPRL